ncbi:hypothetical protein MGALJ_24400 [Mycobacterium gallinarum]|uniref:Uncharacterized protein n=1 Tax=Mycobacterium gallinarum TaxID=39689 RepID=A0A9W4FF87_9MYCO|nr:hypothetical protein MGALJ_24400 [Mycobacterium gallinarum]
MTEGTTMERLAEWMTGPPGSSWTTSAFPHISMMTARRMGRAVNGSYVEFSRSTRRRPHSEPSLVLGGWVSTLCRTRDCECDTAGPDKPAAAS